MEKQKFSNNKRELIDMFSFKKRKLAYKYINE